MNSSTTSGNDFGAGDGKQRTNINVTRRHIRWRSLRPVRCSAGRIIDSIFHSRTAKISCRRGYELAFFARRHAIDNRGAVLNTFCQVSASVQLTEATP